MYSLSLTTGSSVCPPTVWREKVRVPAKDYPVFRSASSLATPGKNSQSPRSLLYMRMKLMYVDTPPRFNVLHISVACKHNLDCTLTHSCTHYFKYFFFLFLQNRHTKVATTLGSLWKNNFSQCVKTVLHRKTKFLWLRGWKILESILETSFFMDRNKILILLYICSTFHTQNKYHLPIIV